VREKARVQGAMASIVEWQSLRMQEYRYNVIVWVARFFELFGIRRPLRFEPPTPAGDYDHALHVDHPEAPSLLRNTWTANRRNPSWAVPPNRLLQVMKKEKWTDYLQPDPKRVAR